MLKAKNNWITICLINLTVVALLGVFLRSKILFSIPSINFKFILNAHSHFAFGGWITLCILTLFTYEILPESFCRHPKYRYLLMGILLTATGMLFSFPFQGYGFVSISFSTLFILITYVFSWVFILDLIKIKPNQTTLVLCTVALAALCVSSVGPFTLAYMMATHSVNFLTYKDAIYSYLHLQYNGFFTLGVFALFFNQLNDRLSVVDRCNAKRFAIVLSIAVVPTLFLSYLWHYPNLTIRSLAFIGCLLLILVLFYFLFFVRSIGAAFNNIPLFTKIILGTSMIAFLLKTAMQIGIVFPALGSLIFENRSVIIGYLHLVMLGFITLFLLGHLLQQNYFKSDNRLTKTGIAIFYLAVIGNEIFLMTQGLSAMLMLNYPYYPVLLWIAAIFLFAGALMISVAAVNYNWRKPVPLP
ncbi:hypothetical protein ACVWYN_003250 [Pedobacter sp. UYP24]